MTIPYLSPEVFSTYNPVFDEETQGKIDSQLFANLNVTKGDVYKFTFKIENAPFLYFDIAKEVQDWIESKAEHFKVNSVYVDNNKNVIAYLEVIDNPLPFVAVFGIVVAGISLVLWAFSMTLVKVEKVVEKPVGGALAIGTMFITGYTLYKLL